MKFLVLGATGQTGRHVARKLVERRHSVTAVCRKQSASLEELEGVKRIEGTILDMSEGEVREITRECDAVLVCLGHNLTLGGIWGKPRRLVTDTVRRIVQSYLGKKKPGKVVLMSSVGVRNKDLPEEDYPTFDRVVSGLPDHHVPPHADNVQAAEYLKTAGDAVEWVCVRPDDLADVHERTTDFEVFDALRAPPISGRGKTTRLEVAHFMASLAENESLWDQWKGKTPPSTPRDRTPPPRPRPPIPPPPPPETHALSLSLSLCGRIKSTPRVL